MPHKEWIENCAPLECAECIDTNGEICSLDSSIPCSPSCPELGENGETSGDLCADCDAVQEE